MNVLITGFGKFGDYKSNPTEELVQQLHGKSIAGYQISSMVFPAEVNPEFGRLLVKEAIRLQVKVILSLGISSQVKGVRFELACRNWVDSAKYCQPKENHCPILQSYPEKARLRVDRDYYRLGLFKHKLASIGLGLEFSRNAGGFCCNALMFSTLNAIHELKSTVRFAFLHLSCTKECLSDDVPTEKLFLMKQEQYAQVVQFFLESN